MPMRFRIIDLSTGRIDHAPPMLTAVSPEAAAQQHFGFEVARSGHRNDLVARVYWESPGHPVNMIRLYRRAIS